MAFDYKMKSKCNDTFIVVCTFVLCEPIKISFYVILYVVYTVYMVVNTFSHLLHLTRWRDKKINVVQNRIDCKMRENAHTHIYIHVKINLLRV